MSKSHPEQWTINDTIERPDPSLVAALRELSTTQIADSGGRVGVVGPGLHRLAGGAEVCGPAVTVWTKPGDILFVLKATDLVGAGDVVVVDGGGREDAAVIGDIVGRTIADLGCVGLVAWWGYLSWATAAKAVLGGVCLFSAPWFVQTFFGQ